MGRIRAEIPKGISFTQFAEILGVVTTTVTNMITKGMPDPTEDWLLSLSWYLKYLDRGRTADLDAVKHWERERARKLQIENDRRESLLVPIADVQQGAMEAASVFSQAMEAMPSRLCGELTGIGDQLVIRDRIERECRSVSEAVSDRLSGLGGIQINRASRKAQAGPNGERVGRRKSSTAARKRRARKVEK